jgi:predicted permease
MREWWRGLGRKWRGWRRREALDQDLAEEMRDHLARKEAELRESGWSAEEAHRRTRLEFGNAARWRESSYEARGWPWLEGLWLDLRRAVRGLRKAPAFFLAVTAAIGLGAGLNIAIFGFADRLLFRSLPVREPERLYVIAHRGLQGGEIWDSVSYPDFTDYHAQATVFEGLAAHGGFRALVSLPQGDERIQGELVSWDFFDVLGVRPRLGRWFSPDEDREPGGTPVVVVSYGFWNSRLGGDPGVIGSQVRISNTPFTVIGVAPRGFRGLETWRDATELWIPFHAHLLATGPEDTQPLETMRNNHSVSMVARLRRGVSEAAAQAQVKQISGRLREEYWQADKASWGDLWRNGPPNWTGVLVPINENRMSAGDRKSLAEFLAMLMTVVGLVLLIACLNAGTLCWVRALRRRREVAVRLALGISQGRLLRELLFENVLLAGAGAVAALGVAALFATALASLYTPFLSVTAGEPFLDVRTLLFGLALAAATVLIFGATPLRQARRTDVVTALKATAGAESRPGRADARRWLIAAQVALSVVLLAGAGLFLRTLANAVAVDITRQAASVLMMPVALPDTRYDDERGQQFYRRLLDRAESAGGVRSAALVMVVPLGRWRGGANILVEKDGARVARQVDFNTITPRYFETLGVPMLRGRAFTDQDRAGAPAVAIVNEVWAQRFWPGESPLGKRIEMEKPRVVMEVVGVVRDGPFRNVRQPVNPCFYVPLPQRYSSAMNLVVRAAGDPRTVAPQLRRVLTGLDADLLVQPPQTLKARRDAGLERERLAAGLLSTLGGLSLLLAALGVFGVVAAQVAERTREIGLRMSLGARPWDVALLVIRRVALWVGVGLAAGFIVARLVSRLAVPLLFRVEPTDPGVYGTIVGLLLISALAAMLGPLRRAVRINPVAALREE